MDINIIMFGRMIYNIHDFKRNEKFLRLLLDSKTEHLGHVMKFNIG